MCVDLENEESDVGFVPVAPREKCQGYLPCMPASDTAGLTQESCA